MAEAIVNIQPLIEAGYLVEDLSQEYPLAHAGEFRWRNVNCGSIQHHDVRAFSEHEAWADAQRHAAQKEMA